MSKFTHKGRTSIPDDSIPKGTILVPDTNSMPLYREETYLDPTWHAKDQKDAKILLHHMNEKLTEQSIAIATNYLIGFKKGNNIQTLPEGMAPKVMRGIKKELKKHKKKIREHDNTIHETLDDLVTVLDKAEEPFEKAYKNLRIKDYGPGVHDIIGQSRKDQMYQDDIALLSNTLEKDFKLEKPQGTSLHHFFDFLLRGAKESQKFADQSIVKFLVSGKFQSFVVEHDWSKAFEGVKDFDGGEIKLPYEYTCFEFKVSGMRVLVLLGAISTGAIEGFLATGINKHWYINKETLIFENGDLAFKDRRFAQDHATSKWVKQLSKEIRAICIMLDARVAVGERRSLGGPGLNKKRAKEGKKPLSDYHVITLSKRYRGEYEQGEPTGIKRRLHWRRGHRRYFQTPGGQNKYIDADGITKSWTWINWQLVGDERLGFVDKHYKL